MDDIKQRHRQLPPLDGTHRTYGSLAADHLRRLVVDLDLARQNAHEVDAQRLLQRVVFALTCVEAHDPNLERHNLGPSMPYAGQGTADDPLSDADNRQFNA